MNLLPELIVFIGALLILIIDIFFGKRSLDQSRVPFMLSLSFAAAALYAVYYSYDIKSLSFNGMFFTHKFTSFAKIIILVLLIGVIFISQTLASLEKRISSEISALMMIATTGSMLLISSNNLIPFYLAIELQSLALYILAAIKINSPRSSEAGIKYFVLGSASSGILLLGISFIYGYTGSTDFSEIFILINQYSTGYINHQISFPIGLLFGFVLLLIGVLFKISAAPFHMWTPDVYEGAPTNITSFFASVIKFTMVLITVKVYVYLSHFSISFNQIMILVAILSLLVGSLGALKQQSFKRLLAYSGIGHIGFITAGLSATNTISLDAVVFYAVVYASISIGAFALLTLIVNKNKKANEDKNDDEVNSISALAGFGKSNPFLAACLAILMLSMAGIPPLAGFFSKFYILLAIIKNELYFLAVIAVLTSVISASYYLKIIKTMYFDQKNPKVEIEQNPTIAMILVLSAMFSLFIIFFIVPLLQTITELFL